MLNEFCITPNSKSELFHLLGAYPFVLSSSITHCVRELISTLVPITSLFSWHQ